MEIEYEATFTNVNKDEIRERLKKVRATLVRPEYLQRRVPFFPPGYGKATGKFARVRDEGNKITMSYKSFDGEEIQNQKELCLEVNDFDKAIEFLKLLGCTPKSYQESKRELWKLDEAEIMLDEWPFLEPFVEIEGKEEKAVKEASEKLGFDYSKALFCATDKIYQEKYSITTDTLNEMPKIVFDMENPFV